MKATPVDSVSSSPAPKEWCKIPEIIDAKPDMKKNGFVEISLQRLDYKGIDLAQWMGAKNGLWHPASEVFCITKGGDNA